MQIDLFWISEKGDVVFVSEKIPENADFFKMNLIQPPAKSILTGKRYNVFCASWKGRKLLRVKEAPKESESRIWTQLYGRKAPIGRPKSGYKAFGRLLQKAQNME